MISAVHLIHCRGEVRIAAHLKVVLEAEWTGP